MNKKGDLIVGRSRGYDGGGRTPDRDNCGGIFYFEIIIEYNQESIWQECEVGQEVFLELAKDILPRLEVKRLSDRLSLGLVPASKIMLISCIEDGWEYRGRIEKITGSDYYPKIYVKVKGTK